MKLRLVWPPEFFCNSAILEKPGLAEPFEVATKYRRIIETDQDLISSTKKDGQSFHSDILSFFFGEKGGVVPD